jgi:hypothetical protein
MLKTLFATAAAVTLMSGIVLADDVNSETTRQSTGIGPLKFETDKTVKSGSDDHLRATNNVEVDKSKTVTKDFDGDTASRTKTESTTVR